MMFGTIAMQPGLQFNKRRAVVHFIIGGVLDIMHAARLQIMAVEADCFVVPGGMQQAGM